MRSIGGRLRVSGQQLKTAMSHFLTGSPMPMNTTLLTLLPNSSCTVMTFSVENGQVKEYAM